MKPTILNKVKTSKGIIFLYTFQGHKDVRFVDIFTNNANDENLNELQKALDNIKSSGYEIYETGKHKINFPEGKQYNVCIKFVVWTKDLSKVYHKTKELFINE